MSEVVLSCENLRKTYQGPAPVQVLLGVDLEVRAGERLGLVEEIELGERGELLRLRCELLMRREPKFFLQDRDQRILAGDQRLQRGDLIARRRR